VSPGIVEANEALEVVVGKKWIGFGLLLEDDLQQYAAGDVPALFGVVEAPVGILLDHSGLDFVVHCKILIDGITQA